METYRGMTEKVRSLKQSGLKSNDKNLTYHHGNLKEELIKTGITLIQQEGIEKLSLRKMAALCGVSEAAPYSHFKNKEDLLRAMQEYVMEQLMTCLQNGYGENSGGPHSILNMGKAYVFFFMEHPEYYTFLFSQPCVKIDLSLNDVASDFPPYGYFKEKVKEVCQKDGFSDERIQHGMIAMWAKVHGIAAIASMKYVTKDFEWEEVLDKILVE